MTAAIEPVVRDLSDGQRHGKAFAPENLEKFRKSQVYRNCNTIQVCPAIAPIPIDVVETWLSLNWPMNAKRARMFMKKMEVGAAYNWAFKRAIDDPAFASYPFVFTMETDNTIPPNALLDLLDAIYTCIDCGAAIPDEGVFCPKGHRGLDGVSGLYWTKSIPPFPMAYGTPNSGELEFRPIDITKALDKEGVNPIIEVNGIANGCALFRKDLFQKLSRPYFETINGEDDEGCATQDLFLCQKAKEEVGARFAVHTGVKVGHMDTSTGEIY